MLTKIKCPKCNTEGSFSLSDPVFDGPYKCWKCREMFHARIEHGVLKSIENLNADELAKLEEVQKLRDKFRKG